MAQSRLWLLETAHNDDNDGQYFSRHFEFAGIYSDLESARKLAEQATDGAVVWTDDGGDMWFEGEITAQVIGDDWVDAWHIQPIKIDKAYGVLLGVSKERFK